MRKQQQVLHPWDLTGGQIASLPLEGDTLVISYFPPSPVSSYYSSSSSFALEIETVLQGTRPLPFSFGTFSTSTSSTPQQLKDHDVVDNTGTGVAGLPNQIIETPPTTPTSSRNEDTYSTITEIQAARVANRSGSALSCLPNAACFPEWKNATQATVLLVLISPLGGRFCTGTLLASPSSNISTSFTTTEDAISINSTASTTQQQQQLLLTANHCRKTDDAYTISNMWAVVFDYGNNCRDSGTSNEDSQTETTTAAAEEEKTLAAEVAPKILQGLDVVYSDELSDILILRVLSEISESSVETVFMGWDVSSFPGSSSRRERWTPNEVGYGTVHYASGDTKKLTNTSSPLRPSKWKSQDEFTHVSAMWSDGGVTMEGSSGASLVDAATGLVVGVLTGGPEPSTCANGKDILGTLYAAWESEINPLWKILSPDGPGEILKMQGQSLLKNGPGIIAAPAFITIRERDIPVAVAAVKLSDPPSPGETITITARLYLPPPAVEILKRAPETASISLIEPTKLKFSTENWNISHRINVDPGSDTQATGSLPFQIFLELSSDSQPALIKRRVLKGVRVDEELGSSGLSIETPVVIESGPDGIQAKDLVTLVAAADGGNGDGGVNGSVNTNREVKLGDVLKDAYPPGSVYFYNISTGDTVELNIVACGTDVPLQIAIYNNSIATWLTSEDCSSQLAPECLAQQDDDGCSGFINFVLPGLLSFQSPYTMTVRTVTGEKEEFELLISQSSINGELYGGPLGRQAAGGSSSSSSRGDGGWKKLKK
jgi:hypothetical protein